MNQDKFFNLQQQVKQNQTELQDFLKDFGSWSDDIKKKDEALKNQKDAPQLELPPVRNSLDIKKRKKKTKKKDAEEESHHIEGKKRISSYDYRAWDKFDVDKACEEAELKSSDSEYETDEEWELQRKEQQATLLKNEGNQFFKEGKWDEAIECYTRGLECDPNNVLLSANRAMALLKQEKYAAAEIDCSAAIILDPKYVKAYSRRGTARVKLHKYTEAKDDFLKVLELEERNSQAKSEIEKIERILNPPQTLGSLEGVESGICRPIHKPLHKRSRKPLRRIAVEEIGIEEHEEQKVARERALRAPSNTGDKQQVIARDEAQFDQILTAIKIKTTDQESQKINSSKSMPVPDQSSDSGICLEDSASSEHYDANPDSVYHNGKSTSESSTTSPRIPDTPTNSFNFQSNWKIVKKMPNDKFYIYIQKIPVENYVKLFGEALDADMLIKILSTLSEHYVTNKKPVFPTLKNLAAVKRFSMTYMFLSAKDKLVVKQLFSYMRSSAERSESEINSLAKLYEL